MRAGLIVICALSACRNYTPVFPTVDAGATLPGLEWQPAMTMPDGAATGMPMTIDPFHHAFYAFGGSPHSDTTTWSLDVDTNTWSALPLFGLAPSGRDGHCAATLPTQAVFVGGVGDSGAASPTTLLLDLEVLGAHEYRGIDNDRPAPGAGCVAAYLKKLGGVVVYSGESTPDDTWLYDGTQWSQLAPMATPGGISQASIVEDPGEVVDGGISDFLIMFGGESGGTESDGTWIFNGDTWAELSTIEDPNDENDYEPRPYGRTGAAVALDPVRRLLYVFGGLTQGTYLADLWRLDLSNVTWNQLTLPSGPTGRANATVGYDVVNDRMLIIGGTNDSGILNDGWALKAISAN